MTYLGPSDTLDADDICFELVSGILHQVLLVVIGKALACLFEAL